MTEPTSAQELFKGRHFDQEIIVLSVRWYLTFKLSSRDLVQMMAERGVTLTHIGRTLKWAPTWQITRKKFEVFVPELPAGLANYDFRGR